MSISLRLTTGPRPLDALLDLPKRAGQVPLVLVVHGFKGFMEWGFFPSLAELLAARGMAVLRLNLSGSGMRPGDELVTDPAAFRDDTYQRELEDVEAARAAVAAGLGHPGRIDTSRLALLGHSRGGGVALLSAARPEPAPLAALVTWSAISTVHRFGETELATWRRRGDLPVVNGRTGQVLALGAALLEEVTTDQGALDLEAAAARRRAPWLIVHGAQDETVPIAEARRLAAAASPPVELVEVAEGDHTYGAKHPFVGPTPPLIAAMNATQRFLLARLR